MISKILNRAKPHTVKVATLGLVIVLLEILLHLFGVDTENYMIFSSNVHWSIFLFLFVMYGEYRSQIKPKKTPKEPWLISTLKSIGIYFGLFLLLLLYILASPSAEILFQENGKMLLQDGSKIYVDSAHHFYMYKHHKSIIALTALLFFYMGFLFPLAKEIKDSHE